MWTDSERKELDREYSRIGIREGELLPAPSRDVSTDVFLAMLRLIPDGGGKAGYVAALARLAGGS